MARMLVDCLATLMDTVTAPVPLAPTPFSGLQPILLDAFPDVGGASVSPACTSILCSMTRLDDVLVRLLAPAEHETLASHCHATPPASQFLLMGLGFERACAVTAKMLKRVAMDMGHVLCGERPLAAAFSSSPHQGSMFLVCLPN